MQQPRWFFHMLDHLEPDVLEEWDERAAIIQYEAGYTKEHAECLALVLVLEKYYISTEGTGKSVSYNRKDKYHE